MAEAGPGGLRKSLSAADQLGAGGKRPMFRRGSFAWEGALMEDYFDVGWIDKSQLRLPLHEKAENRNANSE
jgi:hypothetical protein